MWRGRGDIDGVSDCFSCLFFLFFWKRKAESLHEIVDCSSGETNAKGSVSLSATWNTGACIIVILMIIIEKQNYHAFLVQSYRCEVSVKSFHVEPGVFVLPHSFSLITRAVSNVIFWHSKGSTKVFEQSYYTSLPFWTWRARLACKQFFIYLFWLHNVLKPQNAV